ncbi:MAG: FAD-binding oxidoreductase [Clostridiales Family XIII bacterium]|jgi:sarcosine oxidase subunit beta|nr:FAD-binding oxidoreductase [Clostridiales Family XIII bacterium]
MKKTADVIVVGGGAIGNATAYNLAKNGVDVLVLEADEVVGNGGSSRNGGGVRQSGRDPRELPLAIYGIQHIWPNLKDELGMDVEYHREGNLRLGRTEAHRAILNGLTDRAVECGLDVRMVEGDEAREICPYLSDAVLCASWCATDGHANPMLTTLAFYRAARRLGAVYHSGAKVTEIKKQKGRARQVVTEDGDVYEADVIVLAAGYGSRAIANTVGLEVPMHTQLMEVIVTEGVAPMFWQMLGTADADFYGHQSDHGSFVFGITGGYEDFSTAVRPVSSSIAASSACRVILGYFPILENLKIVRSWAGWIDVTADHVPVFGPVEEVPGLILVCGFSGHGFGICPTAGLLLSELAQGQTPTLPVDAFRYDRFKAPA